MATTAALRHAPPPICLPESLHAHQVRRDDTKSAPESPSAAPLSSAVLLHELLLPHLIADGVAAGAAVVARLASVCRSLKALAQDDAAVWQPLCEALAPQTQPARWLAPADDGSGAPRLYRCARNRRYCVFRVGGGALGHTWVRIFAPWQRREERPTAPPHLSPRLHPAGTSSLCCCTMRT